jgi:hypothetical protein
MVPARRGAIQLGRRPVTRLVVTLRRFQALIAAIEMVGARTAGLPWYRADPSPISSRTGSDRLLS